MRGGVELKIFQEKLLFHSQKDKQRKQRHSLCEAR